MNCSTNSATRLNYRCLRHLTLLIESDLLIRSEPILSSRSYILRVAATPSL